MRRPQPRLLLAALLTAGSLATSCSPRSTGGDFDSGLRAVDTPAPGDRIAEDVASVDAPTVDVGVVDAGPSCRTDRDCSAGLVCDRARSACVQCVSASDCGDAGAMCVGARCVTRTPCVSSRTCDGQVCDTMRGYCVDCLTNVDCPAGQGCAADATCRALVCTPPAAECLSATMGRACDASGTAWTEFLCSTTTMCSGGICRPPTPTCSPGAASCTSTSTLSVCSADGRTTTTTTCAGAANATGRCTGSSCGIACNSGFGDCNAATSDGCEASLTTTANCGACGVRCGTGQTCSAGSCVTASCTPAGGACLGSGCCAGLTCSNPLSGVCETMCPASACRFAAGCGAGSTCRCPSAGCGCPTCAPSSCDGAGNPRTNGTCCAGLSYRATPTVPLCCLEVGSACSTEALSSAECCGSMECRSGRCVCQAAGQPCSDNLDCCSRSCGTGVTRTCL